MFGWAPDSPSFDRSELTDELETTDADRESCSEGTAGWILVSTTVTALTLPRFFGTSTPGGTLESDKKISFNLLINLNWNL